MEIQDRHIDLIAAVLSGNASEVETARLQVWLGDNPEHLAYFEEMQSLWSASEQSSAQFEADVPQAWAKLEDRLDTLDEGQWSGHTPKGRFISPTWWAAAAAVALLLFAGWWMMDAGFGTPELVALQTGPNQKMEHILPDGSVVWLNANSSLTYAETFQPRSLELKGEGFFDVVRDTASPFIVTSGQARTRVLGTSFNVRAYPDEDQIFVTVQSGRVKVEAVDHEEEEALLEAGQRTRLDKETKKLSEVEQAATNVLAWQTETLHFDDTALKTAIRDIESFYQTKIELASPAVGNCPVNGTFKRDSIAALLQKITMISGSQFDQIGNTWVISGPGCPE